MKLYEVIFFAPPAHTCFSFFSTSKVGGKVISLLLMSVSNLCLSMAVDGGGRHISKKMMPKL